MPKSTAVDRLDEVLRKHKKPVPKAKLLKLASVSEASFNKAIHLLSSRLAKQGETVLATRVSKRGLAPTASEWTYSIVATDNGLRARVLAGTSLAAKND